MAITNLEFTIVAGRLCLDFVNTGNGAERLTSYQRLVDWARAAGALDGGEAEFVLERWGTGAEAEDALATALLLRNQLHQLSMGFARGESIAAPATIEVINQLLRSRPGYLQLEKSGDNWAARWKVPLRRADDVLWPVVRSAAALLADDEWQLVKRCERAACGLFFYDGTKNHRKRWCRMDVCGGAERAAAYYRRRKGNAV